MPAPAAAWPARRATGVRGFGLRSSSICVAEKPTNSANTSASAGPLSSANSAGAGHQPADQDAGRHAAHDVPAHGAARVVGAHARQRGEEDGRHRGGDGHLHAPARRPCRAAPAAWSGTAPCIMPPPMPSSPARKPVTVPMQQQLGDEQRVDAATAQRSAEQRAVTARHSAAVTGVIDSRLPRCSTPHRRRARLDLAHLGQRQQARLAHQP